MLHLGKTARYVRKRKGLTVRAAAAELGISHAHLCNIENNQAAPSLQLLDTFRTVYGVDLPVLAWCLYGEPNKLPASVQGPMKALAEAWKRELGDMVEE
jgi:transcriptional regulator with XRE-family HTH domain